MRVTASVTYDQLIREKKQHDQSDLTIPTGSVGNESFTLRMSAHFFFISEDTASEFLLGQEVCDSSCTTKSPAFTHTVPEN